MFITYLASSGTADQECITNEQLPSSHTEELWSLLGLDTLFAVCTCFQFPKNIFTEDIELNMSFMVNTELYIKRDESALK